MAEDFLALLAVGMKRASFTHVTARCNSQAWFCMGIKDKGSFVLCGGFNSVLNSDNYYAFRRANVFFKQSQFQIHP